MINWLRKRPDAVPAEPPPLPEPQAPATVVYSFPPYEVREGLCPTCGVERRESVEFVKERTYDSRYDFMPRCIRLTPLISITPAHLVWTCVACGASRETLTMNAEPQTAQ